MTTYTIEKRTTERECFHPRCYDIHHSGKYSIVGGVHWVEDTVWAVMEDDYMIEGYETKTEARRRIERMT